jgi:hypothetical protein
VAGLWRDNLESQLCWFTVGAHVFRKPPVYVAPSWSCAYVDSFVKYSTAHKIQNPRKRDSLWVSILDVNVTLVSSDDFGPISGANLQASCDLLLHVHLRADSLERKEYMVLKETTIECLIHLDFLPQKDEDEIHEAYALLITVRLPNGHITGLLLKPSTQGKGVYRRVGIFQFWNEELLQSFIETAAAEYPYAVHSDDCVEIRPDKFRDPLYVIHLV